MEQLILHLIGDYVTQSDWMAENKTKAFWPACCHALVYSLPFGLLAICSPRPVLAMDMIFVTHFLIDRYRLARYVVWAKNWLGPKQHWLMFEPFDEWTAALAANQPAWPMIDSDISRRMWQGHQPTPAWRFCRATGYPPGRPEWLAVWLLIIADNTLHLAINYAVLRWM